MKIITDYKTPVIYPDGMQLRMDDDGIMKPWCEPHNEFYYRCSCPKPDSLPEKDGWYIEKQGKILYASPTKELYEAAALWITVGDDKMNCNRCGAKMNINDYNDASKMLSELPYLEMLDTIVGKFYDTHAECKESKATEKHQSAGEGTS